MAKLILNFIAALFLFNSVSALPDPVPFSRQFILPFPATGPDSIAFAKNDQGTGYVTTNDGRILKFIVNSGTFVDFASTSPSRTKPICDGNTNATLALTCGKVFGLSVDILYQVLYLTDVYRGLYFVPLSQGGQATFVTNTAGGQPLKIPNGVDVDPTNSDVYFTDGSLTLDYRNVTPTPTVGNFDSTGRLIRFSPTTGQVTVLVSGLSFPLGPAVNFDGQFVLISQFGAKNIIKYYIKGPRAGTTEILLTLPGFPGQIRRASAPGFFWVPVNQQGGSFIQPFGYLFDKFGIVLVTKDLSQQYPNDFVSTIEETNPSTLYVGDRVTNYITQYYH